MTSAVVFGYHNVGARCLRVLLAHGIDVRLVVTHEDNPRETIWFASVAKIAAEHGIPTIAPEDPNVADVVARVAAERPDFIFSFYYRSMLKPALLDIPSRGPLDFAGCSGVDARHRPAGVCRACRREWKFRWWHWWHTDTVREFDRRIDAQCGRRLTDHHGHGA